MPNKTDVDFLTRSGLSEGVIEAVMRVDALMQNWRRRASRREIGQRALRDLGIGIDLAQLDVLVAIEGPGNEFGATDDGETMVSTVAERLAIDPSRASRIVSEMVDAGYVVRTPSRIDARRTILQLTPAGRAVVEGVQSFKFLLLGRFLADWDRRELTAFLGQLERFGEWAEAGRTASIDEETGILAGRIARHKLRAAARQGRSTARRLIRAAQ